MSAWPENIFGRGSAATQQPPTVETSSDHASSNEGITGDGLSVKQVEDHSRLAEPGTSGLPGVDPSLSHQVKIVDRNAQEQSKTFNLENLDDFADHFEITANSQEVISCHEFHGDSKDQVPTMSQRAYRAITRSKSQQGDYHRGLMQVRKI